MRLPVERLLGLLVGACVGAMGCDNPLSEPPSSCVEVTLSCDPLYLPTTFDNVFERTLVPGCAIGSSSCHGPGGGKGGLIFDEAAPDAGWRALLEPTDAEPRVLAGDPACSPLVQRLHSNDVDFQMPPGTLLSEPELCAVIRWVADGGLR